MRHQFENEDMDRVFSRVGSEREKDNTSSILVIPP